MEKKSSIKKRKSTKNADGTTAEEPKPTKKGPYRNIEEAKKH